VTAKDAALLDTLNAVLLQGLCILDPLVASSCAIKSRHGIKITLRLSTQKPLLVHKEISVWALRNLARDKDFRPRNRIPLPFECAMRKCDCVMTHLILVQALYGKVRVTLHTYHFAHCVFVSDPNP
jgi:hypothetical protein